jgi:hypothetical protein
MEAALEGLPMRLALIGDDIELREWRSVVAKVGARAAAYTFSG